MDRIDFGRYTGRPWSTIPVAFLRFIIRKKHRSADRAKEELKRRADIAKRRMTVPPGLLDKLKPR